jgi:hypothetical protein
MVMGTNVPNWIKNLAKPPTNKNCHCGKTGTALNLSRTGKGYEWVCFDHYQVPNLPKYGRGHR